MRGGEGRRGGKGRKVAVRLMRETDLGWPRLNSEAFSTKFVGIKTWDDR